METSPATRVGTPLLLVAAVIVLLTWVFRGPLWRPNLGNDQPLREAAAASEETSHRIVASPIPETAAATTFGSTVNQPGRVAANQGEANKSPAAGRDPQQQPKAAPAQSNQAPSSQLAPGFNPDDPWAASRCVYVFNPNSSEPTRWKIENGCHAPVGVALGNRSIVLPAAAQRPVTLEEQTVRADSVRYTACFVATAKAISLIGEPSEKRSTPEWREQFRAARASDGCLSRLQGLAD